MASPYHKPLENIKGDRLRPFFQQQPDGSVIFIGETLEVRVCKRFEVYNLLNIVDTVETVGIADLIIDDRYQANLLMLAKFEIKTSDISEMTYQGVPYMVLRLRYGDVFMKNVQVVKDKGIVYALYVEFLTRGNGIYTLGYEQYAKLFDQAKSMCGQSLGVNHAILEMIVAHLARNPDDLFKLYRLMDNQDGIEPTIIPLRSVAFAPDSTSARLLGSYHDEGLNASLLQRNDDSKPFENLLRGLPMPDPSREVR